MELYECVPMAARISRKQCEFNRTAKPNPYTGFMPDARCKGCAGLIIPEEVAAMPTLCAMKGCEKLAQVQGMCKAHAKGTTPRPGRLAAASVTSAEKAALVENVPPVEVVDQSGWGQQVMPDVMEIRNIDYHAYLRQVFDEKYEEFVKELNAAKTPYLRAKYYISMCDSAKALGW